MKREYITTLYTKALGDCEYYKIYSPFGFEIMTDGCVYEKQKMYTALMTKQILDKDTEGYKNFIKISKKYTTCSQLKNRINEIETFIKNNALYVNEIKYKTEEERYDKVRRLFNSTIKEYKDLYFYMYGIKIDIKHLTQHFKHIRV